LGDNMKVVSLSSPKREKRGKSKSLPDPPEYTRLHIWADRYIVPEDKWYRIWIRNESDDPATNCRLYYDEAQTKYFTIPDIDPRSILIAEINPEQAKTIAEDTGNKPFFKLRATIAGVTHTSNLVRSLYTPEPECAVVVFTDPEKKPYYPAMGYLYNKLTGEHWVYEGDRHGRIFLPKTYAEWGVYTLFLHYEDPARKLIALAVIDDYDFTDMTVSAGLTDRATIEYTLKPTVAENFMKAVVSLMPPPLSWVVAWFGDAFGWLSAQVTNIVCQFLNNYIIRSTGHKNITVTWNPEEKVFKAHVVITFGSPLPVWILFLVVIAAIAVFFVVAIHPLKYWDVQIESARVEQARLHEESLEHIKEMQETLEKEKEEELKKWEEQLEAGIITEEEYKKLVEETIKRYDEKYTKTLEAIEALDHYTETREGVTPPYLWIEKLLGAMPMLFVMLIIFVAILMAPRILEMIRR